MITYTGGIFSNGCKYPGDQEAAPEEFINCRCCLTPFIPEFGTIPPPGASQWTEDDMIQISSYFTNRIPGVGTIQAPSAITKVTTTSSNGADVVSSVSNTKDKYKNLTKEEQKTYKELMKKLEETGGKIGKDKRDKPEVQEGKLGLLERHKLKELHEKVIGIYEKPLSKAEQEKIIQEHDKKHNQQLKARKEQKQKEEQEQQRRTNLFNQLKKNNVLPKIIKEPDQIKDVIKIKGKQYVITDIEKDDDLYDAYIKKFSKKLTEQQNNAMKSYSVDPDFRYINAYYRGGKKAVQKELLKTEYYNKYTKSEQKKELKNIIEKTKATIEILDTIDVKIDDNILKFRGVTNLPANAPTKIGETVEFKGLTSSSLSYEQAEIYATKEVKREGKRVLYIILPNNKAKTVPILDKAVDPSEKEVAYHNKTKFKLIDKMNPKDFNFANETNYEIHVLEPIT